MAISINEFLLKMLPSLVLFTLLSLSSAQELRLSKQRELHQSKYLTNAEISQLASLTDEAYFKEALRNILTPRVVGTPGHEKVRNYIVNELRKMNWDVEEHRFQDFTPLFGNLEFTNIIATSSKNVTRQLVLACHYDSKYFKEFQFVAATDSAVPCAMLLHLAKVLTPTLRRNNVGFSLVFFDGEEAFREWSDKDSLYGSRALAQEWSNTVLPSKGPPLTFLDRIDMLVLLDLIGTKDQKFVSFFQDTAKWHLLLSKIEKKLKSMGIVPYNQPHHFLEKSTLGRIEDDHIPFLQRNVPVVHLIPPRFPDVWHSRGDDYSVLHFPTIDTLNKVLQVFVYAYIHGHD